MLDSQQKRKIKQIIYHKVTIAILLVVVVFVLRSTWAAYDKKEESEGLKNISLRYKSQLDERNRKLESQMERLETEAGKEEEIRMRFGVTKGDENIAVIVEEKATATIPVLPESLWQKLLNLFKK